MFVVIIHIIINSPFEKVYIDTNNQLGAIIDAVASLFSRHI